MVLVSWISYNIQFSIHHDTVKLGFPTCYLHVLGIVGLISVVIFGNVPHGMKIALPDMYICIWQVCHKLKFSSALGFVVFNCILSCFSRF